MDYTRDLSSAELWAQSLERSLGRRGRPRRASLELGRLMAPRDLAEDGALSESTLYWRHRRAASASSSFPVPAAGGASMLALLAATTLPSLTGASVTRGKRGSAHAAGRSGVGASIAAVHRRAFLARTAPRATAPAPAAFVKLATTAAVSAPAARAATAVKAPPSYGTVSHGDIVGVQKMLGLAPDGVLGPHTGAAIRSFQAAHGLTVDGDVGFATWTAMKAAHASAAAAPATHLVASTSAPRATTTAAPATSSVHALQTRLGLAADGSYGSTTKSAVEAFQAAHGLTVDGVVGSATRAALGLGDGPTLEPSASGSATVQATETAATASNSASTTASSSSASVTSSTATSSTATSTTATSGAGVGSAVSSTQSAISAMLAAGDQIATLPYIWGGGHGSWVAAGYDCSGSVSYVLHAAGLLSSPEDSGTLESYGAPGPGRYVTIYANAGHAWMTIDGRRFDTVSLAENGSRWGTTPGDPTGFVVRHPVGF